MLTNRMILIFYCLLSCFKSSIHYIHLIYYVQTYISIYEMNFYAFTLVECLFLVWNCSNDILFGWLSDRLISDRLKSLKYLSIAFCLSSLLFWYPVNDLLSMNLLVSLCLYDSCLTMIDLNMNSLLIDLKQMKRERLSSANALGNAIGDFFLSRN